MKKTLKSLLCGAFLILIIFSISVAHDSGIPGYTPYSVFDQTTTPTVNDDAGEGFTFGSLWGDVTGLKEYVCVDNTSGAAVWIENTEEPGGNNTEVQFNDSGDFNGDAGFSYNKTTDVVSLKEIDSADGVDIKITLGTDAGDDFIAGNNNALVVEGDNDRVGVGTNTPQVDFHVNGTSRFLQAEIANATSRVVVISVNDAEGTNLELRTNKTGATGRIQVDLVPNGSDTRAFVNVRNTSNVSNYGFARLGNRSTYGILSVENTGSPATKLENFVIELDPTNKTTGETFQVGHGGYFGGVPPSPTVLFKVQQTTNAVQVEIESQAAAVTPLKIKGASSQSGDYFNITDSSDTVGYRVDADFDMSIGSGSAGKNYRLLFIGEDSTGILTWMEDEAVFDFDSTVNAEGLVQSTTTITASTYTATRTDYTILIDATSNNVTVTLPNTGIDTGQLFYIKLINSSNVGKITSSATIDDDGNDITLTLYESLTVQWDGSEYWVI